MCDNKDTKPATPAAPVSSCGPWPNCQPPQCIQEKPPSQRVYHTCLIPSKTPEEVIASKGKAVSDCPIEVDMQIEMKIGYKPGRRNGLGPCCDVSFCRCGGATDEAKNDPCKKPYPGWQIINQFCFDPEETGEVIRRELECDKEKKDCC